MKVTIKIEIQSEYTTAVSYDIASLERIDFVPERVGMTLSESKSILSSLQKHMINQQIAEFIQRNRVCSECGKKRTIKDYPLITFRTLFGKLKVQSPRLKGCACDKKNTLSPVSQILKERIAPELKYLQTKWASLMSFGVTAKLINEVLPIDISTTSIQNNLQEVAERIESELEEEKFSYIDCCGRDIAELPMPDEPLTVGIDGGYVHARDGDNRKAGWFEVIAGKSLQNNHNSKRFGFVTTFDQKPKSKINAMLKDQGLQMNQAITFLSDGGDNVRDLQLFLSPQAEHILDWFHITMRITVMRQMSKSIKIEGVDLEEKLDRIKWFLWHGNTYHALSAISDLTWDVGAESEENPKNLKLKKLADTVEEFYGYIEANQRFIVCYQDRHHYGECISTAFVESTINEVVSKRMVKKQQMRWTKKGAHLLLQVRTKTLDNDLKGKFLNWYPQMDKDDQPLPLAA